MGHNKLLKKSYLPNGYCVRQLLNGKTIAEPRAVKEFYAGMCKYQLMPQEIVGALDEPEVQEHFTKVLRFVVRWANLLLSVQATSHSELVPHLDNFQMFAKDLGFPGLREQRLLPSLLGHQLLSHAGLVELVPYRVYADLGSALSFTLATGSAAAKCALRVAKALDSGCVGAWNLQHRYAFEMLNRRNCASDLNQPSQLYLDSSHLKG